MTAIVGVLNKKGVAIAADSAVTQVRGKGRKILNSANKMLRLSTANPVSVMTAGNAALLDLPWDIIIRRYRHLHGKKSFPNVMLHIQNFLRFLSEQHLFCSEEVKKDNLFIEFYRYLDLITEVSYKARPVPYYRSVIRLYESWDRKNGCCPQFSDYSEECFYAYCKDFIDEGFLYWAEDTGKLSVAQLYELKADIIHGFYIHSTHQAEKNEGTELIFSGFGEDDIYPSMIRVWINGGFDGRILYQIQTEDIIRISEGRPSAICEFAQTNTMKSTRIGVNSDHIFEAESKCGVLIQHFVNYLKERVVDAGLDEDDFESLIAGVSTEDLKDKFSANLHKWVDGKNNKWEKELVSYGLQDLAKLAESLIDITSLNLQMTFEDESVGGPIDLALITKDDGFMWLKHKYRYGVSRKRKNRRME